LLLLLLLEQLFEQSQPEVDASGVNRRRRLSSVSCCSGRFNGSGFVEHYSSTLLLYVFFNLINFVVS
jgi:hypothetical protein